MSQLNTVYCACDRRFPRTVRLAFHVPCLRDVADHVAFTACHEGRGCVHGRTDRYHTVGDIAWRSAIWKQLQRLL